MNESPRNNTDESLQIWLPTFIALAGMGILTLITPLFTTLTDQQWTIDLVVGGLMTTAGAIGIVFCQRKLCHGAAKIREKHVAEVKVDIIDVSSIEVAITENT